MKKIILIATALISLPALFAQNCLQTIPASVVPVDSDGVNIQDGDVLWFCEGVTFELVGESTTAYIEIECDITITGDNQGAIYMKGPGSLTIDSDNGYYLLDSNVSYIDNGTGNTIEICYVASNQALEYDYATAPSMPDCWEHSTSGINSLNKDLETSVYPNPASNLLNIKIKEQEGVVNFVLYSASGQQLQNGTLSGPVDKIDISSLMSGLYFLELNGKNGRKIESISVQ